jgi:hypothetical protein
MTIETAPSSRYEPPRRRGKIAEEIEKTKEKIGVLLFGYGWLPEWVLQRILISVRHAESKAVVKGFLATAQKKGDLIELRRFGEWPSSNSVRLYVGAARDHDGSLLPGQIMIGGAHVVSRMVDYAAWQFRGDKGFPDPELVPKGFILLPVEGKIFWYNPQSVETVSSWRLSREIGHEAKTEFLQGKEALEKWEELRRLWGLDHEVLRFHLPGNYTLPAIKK